MLVTALYGWAAIWLTGTHSSKNVAILVSFVSFIAVSIAGYLMNQYVG